MKKKDNPLITSNQPSYIRPASKTDIPVLVSHHRKMFEEIWEKKEIPFDPLQGDLVEIEYTRKLTTELKTGACSAWVMIKDNTIVSSGAISIMSYVPNPNDPNSRIAFLHSIYTEKEYRNRKYASRITKEAVRFCMKKGINRIYLFASNEGKQVYKNQGFIPVDNMMIREIPSLSRGKSNPP